MKTHTMIKRFITIDIGASSGRVMVVTIAKKITYEEVSRFEIRTIRNGESDLILQLDLLISNIMDGLRKSINKYPDIISVGIDTWGVDYGYLHDGCITGNPFFYRSLRTKKVLKIADKILDKKTRYIETGIQDQYFNTIYQMLDDKINQDLDQESIDNALLLPDIIAFYLTGAARTEITNLSTTGLYKSHEENFISRYEEFVIKKNLFPPLIKPTEIYGTIRKELNLSEIPVIAVCTHDTASAIVSLPLEKEDVFISSGTWSLLGSLLEKPIINESTYLNNFTNELGYGGKIRFLKNINGLFIANKCLEEISKINKDINYELIEKALKKTNDFETFIDVNHPIFENPKSMLESIRYYAKVTKQKVPENIGEIFKCIYQSLAFMYKDTLDMLSNITNTQYENIYIIGGGSRIKFINQLLASITGLKVTTGSTEASALGNAIVQMMSSGAIESILEGQKLILQSEKTDIYYPKPDKKIHEAYLRYQNIKKRGQDIGY